MWINIWRWMWLVPFALFVVVVFQRWWAWLNTKMAIKINIVLSAGSREPFIESKLAQINDHRNAIRKWLQHKTRYIRVCVCLVAFSTPHRQSVLTLPLPRDSLSLYPFYMNLFRFGTCMRVRADRTRIYSIEAIDRCITKKIGYGENYENDCLG